MSNLHPAALAPFLRSVRSHAFADNLDAGMLPAEAEQDAERVARIAAETIADLSHLDRERDRGDR